MSQGAGAGGFRDAARTRTEALQPATVKQLLEATQSGPSDEYSVNGVGLQQVTLVARLSRVNVQVTMMSMTLDDGTGTLECVHMLPPDEDAAGKEYALQRRQLLRDGAWARIAGRVTEAGGARQVEAFMLRAVDDHNELTYHRLDVVKTMVAQTKTRKRPMGGFGGGTQGVAMGGAGVGMGMGGGGAQTIGADGLMLSQVQRAVFEYAKQRHDASNSGDGEMSISVADVARDVPAVGSAQAAKQVLDDLASDGHVYSTHDENHYAFCQV